VRFVCGAGGREGIVIEGLIIVGIDGDVGSIAHLAYSLHQGFLAFWEASGRGRGGGGRLRKIGRVWDKDGLRGRSKWATGRSTGMKLLRRVKIVSGAFGERACGVGIPAVVDGTGGGVAIGAS